jgi:hypothetical protein
MTVTPWEAFAAEVRDALAETTRLEAVEDPEATPFKSKEAALQLVEAVLTKLQQQCVRTPHISFLGEAKVPRVWTSELLSSGRRQAESDELCMRGFRFA